MSYQITKQYRAEIAHRLPGHPGGCKFIHGHSYLFEITVEEQDDELNSLGMVCDFKYLKEVIEKVIGPWDHSLVLFDNDPLVALLRPQRDIVRLVEVPFIPTAENMAKYLGFEINISLPVGIDIVSVRVWETSTSYAEWRRRG